MPLWAPVQTNMLLDLMLLSCCFLSQMGKYINFRCQAFQSWWLHFKGQVGRGWTENAGWNITFTFPSQYPCNYRAGFVFGDHIPLSGLIAVTRMQGMGAQLHEHLFWWLWRDPSVAWCLLNAFSKHCLICSILIVFKRSPTLSSLGKRSKAYLSR